MSLGQSLVKKAGRHYVHFRLAQLGWDAKELPRREGGNLVATREGSREVSFRVNSLSGRNAAGQGTDVDDVVANYVIVCRFVERLQPECFILTGEEVRKLVECNTGQKQNCWLQIKDYESPDHSEQWGKLRPIPAGI